MPDPDFRSTKNDELTEHGWDAFAEFEGDRAYKRTMDDGYEKDGAEIERHDAIQQVRDYQADPLERDDLYLIALSDWKSTLTGFQIVQYFVRKPGE